MRALFSILIVCLAGGSSIAASADRAVTSPNGIEMPENYRDWRLIGSSHRTDNNTLRVILGNDVAIKYAREGKPGSWPDGSILAKLVWKDEIMPEWKAATSPGDFVLVDFMIKDSTKYKSTGGWGFARWKGLDQKPFGKDASFEQECAGCHEIAKSTDNVFTRPSSLP